MGTNGTKPCLHTARKVAEHIVSSLWTLATHTIAKSMNWHSLVAHSMCILYCVYAHMSAHTHTRTHWQISHIVWHHGTRKILYVLHETTNEFATRDQIIVNSIPCHAHTQSHQIPFTDSPWKIFYAAAQWFFSLFIFISLVGSPSLPLDLYTFFLSIFLSLSLFFCLLFYFSFVNRGVLI